MSPARLFPRSLVLLLVVALLVVAMPVAPVVAQEVAPETVSEVLEDLEAAPTEADEPAEDLEAAPMEADEPADADDLADDGASEQADEVDAHEADVSETPELSDTDDVVEDASEVVESLVKEASIPFNNLGVKASGDQTVHFRTLSLDGDWQPWETVEPLDEEDGPDEGTDEADSAEEAAGSGWVSDAIWVGDSSHIQVRVEGGDLDDIEVHTIDSMGLSESFWKRVSRSARSFTTPAPAEAATYPGLVTRSQWGANETWRGGGASYATVRFAVLHHTAGTNNYSRADSPGVVRGIYHWHTQGNGWNDVGYNILVDRYGTVYEGRYGGVDRGVIGAHASGYNTGSFGVGVMGNFDTAQVPTAAFNATRDVIAWKYAVHGLNASTSARVTANGRSIPTLVGHRDVGTTACPGRYFYNRMGEMRSGIASRVGAFEAAAPSTSWSPVVGDWNADGRTNIGWFREGQWRLRYWNSAGPDVVSFKYGRRGDIPIVGDWNGDGRDTVGIVRDGEWHLRNSNSSGNGQHSFVFGRVTRGDIPLAGDWNGDGRDTVGIVRDGEWHLRNRLGAGNSDVSFVYGRVTRGDVPLIGDWNRNGKDTVGIVRDGEWHLRNSTSSGNSDLTFVYGRVTRGDVPVVGDWSRDGRSTAGITRGGVWHLRNSLSSGASDNSFVYR